MRAVFLALPLIALAGCMSAPEEMLSTATPLPPTTDPAAHAALLAEVDGDFLWNCAVPGMNGGRGWNFLIRDYRNETGGEIVLETAGTDAVYLLDRRSEPGLDRFVAGSDEIAIGLDGHAELRWTGVGGQQVIEGQCRRGGIAA